MGLRVGRWITPPEVSEIASNYRAIAEQVRIIAQNTSQIGERFDVSWIGNAKNIFVSHFNGFPNEIISYADWLDEAANSIANIQVWVPDQEE